MKKAICILLSISWLAKADNLPSGGNIVSGSAEITTSGNTMNITQSSDKVVAHWQDFSIGHGNEVNFIQPSQSSVALNKVLGSNVSLIQGALNANGQVFLINPNGITFSSQAQVNVGGLVASTQNISTEDFLASQYNFDGHSSSAIINQGNITALDTGTIALIAAKVINNGTIEAHRGNVIFGSGNKLTLDLGGPVKLEVHEGTIDGLIEQGGAVRADGGLIYLSTKSLSELTSSVINHTGVTEAKTLSTGENGQIMLMGDMDYGITKVSGHINASAPDGGNGGFIETSAARVKVTDDARVTTVSTHGESGLWLIDPIDFTVAASGVGDMTGAAVESALAGGNHTVETSNPGGNIYINDAVSWSTNMLTLKAHNNIIINSNLVATGSASLEFKYGQDSSSGGTSTYTIADGVDVLIPNAEAFTWKKGSVGTVNKLIFGNQYLRFGGNPSDLNNLNFTSINSDTGALTQPYFYDQEYSRWQKLTYQNQALDYAIGTGGDGSIRWNTTGAIVSTDSKTGNHPLVSATRGDISINIAKYREGIGDITVKTKFPSSESGSTIELTNNYHLEQDKKFARIKTTVENESTSAPLTNVRLWVGTSDDYISEEGGGDNPFKVKGNIVVSFEPLVNQNSSSNAVKILQKDPSAPVTSGSAVLFFSTSTKADSITTQWSSDGKFDAITDRDPRASLINTPSEDGAYGLYLRMDDLPATTSETLTWYYAADAAITIDQVIDDIVIDVEQARGGYTPAPTPSPAPVSTDIPETAAISDVQSIITIVNNAFTPPLKIDFSDNFGSSDIFQVGTPNAIAREVTQVKGSNQGQTIGNQQGQAIGSQQNQAVGNQQDQTVGSQQNQAVGNQQDQTVGSQQDQTIGSQQDQAIGSQPDQAIGSEQSQTVGNEQGQTVGNEQSQEKDTQQSESVAELYGKVDITGPLKVFVIDGGIRVPIWASEKNQD